MSGHGQNPNLVRKVMQQNKTRVLGADWLVRSEDDQLELILLEVRHLATRIETWCEITTEDLILCLCLMEAFCEGQKSWATLSLFSPALPALTLLTRHAQDSCPIHCTKFFATHFAQLCLQPS